MILWEPGMKLTYVDEKGKKYEKIPKGYKQPGPTYSMPSLATGVSLWVDPDNVPIYSPEGWKEYERQQAELERKRQEDFEDHRIRMFDGCWDMEPCYHKKTGWKGVEIDMSEVGAYGDKPNMREVLDAISAHFGTKEIDYDNIVESGCDSCDYGAKDGYMLQVYKITKNMPKFMGEQS